MAGNNWMDDRERQIREREGRGLSDYRSQADEDRTWDTEERSDPYAARRQGRGRDRVFGERDTGVGYNRAGSNQGWQDPAYRGVSPAMRRGDYRRPAQRFAPQDYRTQSYRDEVVYGGGRDFADGRGRIDRETYGEADIGLGDDYSPTRERYHAMGYGQPGYGEEAGHPAYRTGASRAASGGTGGYDYERGYGDGGFRDMDRARDRQAFTRKVERAGHDAGAFLRRTGQQVADWFNAGGEGALYDDLSANPPARGELHRGRGPQGYKRADDRISEDAHERLTDDPWLDASDITLSVNAGEVTLSGNVEHREAKHRAERIVEDISGVTHVQNNLRVARGSYFTSPGAGYGDSVLGAQIRAAEGDAEPPPVGKKN